MNTRNLKSCGVEIEVEKLGRAARMLRLLAHPDRLTIVGILDRRGAMPVHGIMRAMGLAQNLASQHLTQMQRVGLLASERRGREVWYRVGDESAVAILGCLRRCGALRWGRRER
jgi:ArsR family transcriptional regulator